MATWVDRRMSFCSSVGSRSRMHPTGNMGIGIKHAVCVSVYVFVGPIAMSHWGGAEKTSNVSNTGGILYHV